MFTESLGDGQVASSDPNALIQGVEAVLSVPDAELDYARANVSLDALVDCAAAQLSAHPPGAMPVDADPVSHHRGSA
jgi:hypothetical protein